MLSLSLPFGRSEAAASAALRAQCLHPHRQRRPDRADHALCRDGAGHLHLDPDADRGGTRGEPQAGPARARAARTKSSTPIRCWACRRPAIRTRSWRLEAAARGRCDGARDADRRSGQALGRRSASLPRAGGEVLHPATGRRLKYGALAADAAQMPVPESVRSRSPKDFKLIGTPAKRLDAPAKVNGTAPLRHRCAPARREDRHAGAVARVRRPAEERRRHRRQGRQGRAPDRAARRCRRRRRRPHGRGQEGPGGAQDRMGRRPARRACHAATSRASSSRRRFGRPGRPEYRRRRPGDGRRRHQGRGDLSGAVPGACHDGADELHGACPQGRAATSGSAPRRWRASRRWPRRPPACRSRRSSCTII